MNLSSVIVTDPSFKSIDFNESLKLVGYRHAAHCCLFSRSSTSLWKDYVSSSLIYMQMRFDGSIGFPGGVVDDLEGTDILSALNRELVEEINLKPSFHASKEDYFSTHINISSKFCLHFYVKEVLKEDFKSIELDTITAEDFGIETFGLIRVPMFVMNDNKRGLPTFLKNKFAGCAKDQLLNFIVSKNILSYEQVKLYLVE